MSGFWVQVVFGPNLVWSNDETMFLTSIGKLKIWVQVVFGTIRSNNNAISNYAHGFSVTSGTHMGFLLLRFVNAVITFVDIFRETFS
jgi:hypothetical protein